MEIYKPTAPYLVRLQIRRKGEDTKYLTLYKTTPKEVQEWLRDVLKQVKVPLLLNDVTRTGIYIREAQGSKNGKNISVSFRGLSTQETYDLIIEKLQQK